MLISLNDKGKPCFPVIGFEIHDNALLKWLIDTG